MKALQIKQLLIAAIKNKTRILLVGKPGLGKTALVKWAVNHENADLVTLYGSISDPTDFKGMPCIIDGKPDFVPFGDLEKIFNSQRTMVVFLDDLGQGSNAVQAAQMSFMDRVKDNPNVVIIGATNGRGDRANVSGLLEPVKSRFDSIVNMEFSMEDWIKDFALPEVQANRMPIELVAFNQFRPSLMYSVPPSADLVNSPSPRTIAALGKLMIMNLPVELQYEAYSGAVGEGYATELLGYLPICRKLVKIDSILQDPMGCSIPDHTDPMTASIFFAINNALVKKTTESNFQRVIQFAGRMPKEFELALVTDCIRSNKELTNTAAYIQWGTNNQNILI
jgi:hypothetical protein